MKVITQEQDKKHIELLRTQAREIFPSFGGVINSVNVAFDRGDTQTAEAGIGEININRRFMQGLSSGTELRDGKEQFSKQQLFLFMHEVCHIAFGHCGDLDGKDAYLWNLACDAVINIWLQSTGLPIPNGLVNMPDAQKYKSVEDLYNKLAKQKDGKLAAAKVADAKDLEKAGRPEFAHTGGVGDDHSGWAKEAEKIKKGEIPKPKKLHYPEQEAFITNAETRESNRVAAIADAQAEVTALSESLQKSSLSKIASGFTFRDLEVIKDGKILTQMQRGMLAALDAEVAAGNVNGIEATTARTDINKMFASAVTVLRLRNEGNQILWRREELKNLDWNARQASREMQDEQQNKS